MAWIWGSCEDVHFYFEGVTRKSSHSMLSLDASLAAYVQPVKETSFQTLLSRDPVPGAKDGW